MKKQAVPHVETVDGKNGDLYLEYVEPSIRKDFFEDYLNNNDIKMPNDIKVNDIIIHNELEEINNKDITERSQEAIIRHVLDKRKTLTPYFTYDKARHKFKLKPKHDLENLVGEFVRQHS